MEKIRAPFSDEQVKNINQYQTQATFHPFTCCGYDGCKRDVNDGILTATKKYLICPCGKVKQKWVWEIMATAQDQK